MKSALNENGEFVLVCSPDMLPLALSVQKGLVQRGVKCNLRQVEHKTFSNGECLVRILETVRLQHAFFFHGLQYPDPNTSFMQMLLTSDALRRASVGGITLVLPYMTYLRQDRKDQPRVPISASLMAELIEANNSVKKLITFDMHTDQAQGFFKRPVDNISTRRLFAKYFGCIYKNDHRRIMVVAPDFGAAPRSRKFAEHLSRELGQIVPVGILEKNRLGINQSEVLSFVGESIEGAVAIIYDDMIDTGGTMRKAVQFLAGHGAAKVVLSATHGVFSGDAIGKFSELGAEVICTDSIPRSREFLDKNCSWLQVISVSEMLTEAIFQSMTCGGSISQMNA